MGMGWVCDMGMGMGMSRYAPGGQSASLKQIPSRLSLSYSQLAPYLLLELPGWEW